VSGLVGHWAQHLGGRGEQHDAVLVEPGLFLIADGNGVMGDCSRRVLALFRQHLRDQQALGFAAEVAIEKAVQLANDDLCAYLRGEIQAVLDRRNPDAHAMGAIAALGPAFVRDELGSGSTLVGLVDDRFVVHVGDSRAYRVVPARGEVTLVTRDHVWPVDDETVEIADTIYKYGLAIARVLGHPQLEEHGVSADPDVIPFELAAGEYMLLCSDGLRPYLEQAAGDRRLCELATTRSPAETVAIVIAEASEISHDNVSLILIGSSAQ
jgi:serine/threonine protein phosphatase PrpC